MLLKMSKWPQLILAEWSTPSNNLLLQASGWLADEIVMWFFSSPTKKKKENKYGALEIFLVMKNVQSHDGEAKTSPFITLTNTVWKLKLDKSVSYPTKTE